ncbi:MAG: shikimate kinase [Deltaproteobacteria bacterium]|nr:shikimate kinase [Deltaproteobacteria bacterium]
MNIVLTGFMGTGKSSVGKRLAEGLGLEYADTDDLIEARAGMKVRKIFAEKGEAFFLALEKDVIRDITSGKEGLVLSTGGGAVIDEANRRFLRGWGTVVCLAASSGTILERVGSGDERPLLDRPDRKAYVEELLKRREAAYRDCDLLIDTTKKGVEEVTEEIRRFLFC